MDSRRMLGGLSRTADTPVYLVVQRPCGGQTIDGHFSGGRRRTIRKETGVRNCMGQWGIHELVALVSRMTVYVVSGTGPPHVAAWARIKTISPFCATPGLSPAIWGNTSGNGVTRMPPAAYCAAVRKRRHGHCDFGGHVTAETLWQTVSGVL